MTYYNVCVCGNAVANGTIHPECDWCDEHNDYATECVASH
jgi:hypothetical protein